MLPNESLQEASLSLKELTTSELARRMAIEADHFLRRKTTNEAYGRELFRRALTEGEDTAWAYIYQQFKPLVLSWITRYEGVISLLANDDADELIHASFVKFWRSLSQPGKVEFFESLADLLKYLKMVVHSVVTDAMRARQTRHYEETLELLDVDAEPRTEDTPEDIVLARTSADDLWQIIQAEVKNEEERLLLYLTYVQNMQPREICSAYRNRFPTVDDVYRIKRNILERLRRNQHMKRLLVKAA